MPTAPAQYENIARTYFHELSSAGYTNTYIYRLSPHTPQATSHRRNARCGNAHRGTADGHSYAYNTAFAREEGKWTVELLRKYKVNDNAYPIFYDLEQEDWGACSRASCCTVRSKPCAHAATRC